MFDLLKLLRLENIFDNLVGFIETKIEFYKVQFKEEIAKALGMLIFLFFLSQLILLFLIFISFFLVAYINYLLSSQNLGFLIIAIIYMILGLLLFLFREKLIFRMILKEFFNNDKKVKVPEIND